MSASERRAAIMKVLYMRRHDTIDNLAVEFGVSSRTIRRDIEALSLTEPIYTQSGRYGGGVYVLNGYYSNRIKVSNDESELLNRIGSIANNQLRNVLSDNEHKTLKNMINKYSHTTNKNS